MSTPEDDTWEADIVPVPVRSASYAVGALTVTVIPNPEPDAVDRHGRPLYPDEEIIVSVPNQPGDSVLVAHAILDEDAGTGEGLLVCYGSTDGTTRLEDRDAAVAKFTELAGRAPEEGELP